MNTTNLNTNRPYLVIPKLVVQPTWGGNYIVENKGWTDRPGHNVKIGQSYEIFSGSNLSLLNSSADPDFQGEITDRDAVQIQTRPNNSITLADLVATNPASVLGQTVADKRGTEFALLIKFTQALGNSFQAHIRDGVTHEKWKPKPESWYYFEPGLLTFGVKADADWDAYEDAIRTVHAEMTSLSQKVTSGALDNNAAHAQIKDILDRYDPWQYVNTVAVKTDQIVNLSAGGIHHSWEEDPEKAPLGNVLLELQGEAMDDVSTFRSFDKGKMADDGTIRDVHIDTYFDVIDRSQDANDPKKHIQEYEVISENASYRLDKLMRSRHYDMDKLTLMKPDSHFQETIARYKHLFVKSGSIRVSAGGNEVTVTTGHSCFVPAAASQYEITNLSEKSEVLISF